MANIKTAVNYSRTISALHLIISVLHYYFLLAPVKCEHNASTAFSTRIERQMADLLFIVGANLPEVSPAEMVLIKNVFIY